MLGEDWRGIVYELEVEVRVVVVERMICVYYS